MVISGNFLTDGESGNVVLAELGSIEQPLGRPALRTRQRSLTLTSSGMSDELDDGSVATLSQLTDDSMNFDPGPDVDASSGFIQQQDTRIAHQGSSEHHLLLISTSSLLVILCAELEARMSSEFRIPSYCFSSSFALISSSDSRPKQSLGAD